MANSRGRGILVWAVSLVVLAIFLVPTLFLAWVTKRAEEGTLPLPESLKPSSTPVDSGGPSLGVPKPTLEDKVIARVLDDRGGPRAGIPILLFFVRATGQGTHEWSVQSETNETGWATFPDLPTRFAGGFVEATPTRGWPVRREFSFDGTWPCRVEVVVPDGRGLRVVARDEGGAPLDRVEVRAVLHRRLEKGDPLYGRWHLRGAKERNPWRLRMKEILRGPDGVERWVDGWTSEAESRAEEGIVIAGRPMGGGEYDFPRIHPEASVRILAWGEGRALSCVAVPGVEGAGGDARVELVLPRAAALRGPVLELPDGTPASGRSLRLLPSGVPTWLNTGMPAWRTDGSGRLSGPAIDGDREYSVVLEAPDTDFDGVTRYLDISGSWRPASEDPLRLEREVPPISRSSTPQPVENR